MPQRTSTRLRGHGSRLEDWQHALEALGHVQSQSRARRQTTSAYLLRLRRKVDGEASKEKTKESLTAWGKGSPRSRTQCLRDLLGVGQLHLCAAHGESETWGTGTSNAAHFLVAIIRTGEFIVVIPSLAMNDPGHGHRTPHICMSSPISNSSPPLTYSPYHATVPRSTAGWFLIPDGGGVACLASSRLVIVACLY
jgi:hypothetical protein